MASGHLIIEIGSLEETSRKINTQFIIFFKSRDVLWTCSDAKQTKALELVFGAEKGLLQDQAMKTGQFRNLKSR